MLCLRWSNKSTNHNVVYLCVVVVILHIFSWTSLKNSVGITPLLYFYSLLFGTDRYPLFHTFIWLLSPFSVCRTLLYPALSISGDFPWADFPWAVVRAVYSQTVPQSTKFVSYGLQVCNVGWHYLLCPCPILTSRLAISGVKYYTQTMLSL